MAKTTTNNAKTAATATTFAPYSYDYKFPVGEFTIRELLTLNNFEITRIAQIKTQRKLNRLVAKGELAKAKRGLEGVFAVIAGDKNVKGEAFTPTNPEDITLDFAPVTFGSPATIEVGYTAAGRFVTVTKTQKYASSRAARYDVAVDGEIINDKATNTNLDKTLEFTIGLFKHAAQFVA